MLQSTATPRADSAENELPMTKRQHETLGRPNGRVNPALIERSVQPIKSAQPSLD